MKNAIILIFVFFAYSCNLCETTGTQELGNNLVLYKGDIDNGTVILHCSSRSGGCCTGGTYIIPTYENHYTDSGYEINEYIVTAQSNENWIIAKSRSLKKNIDYYWIVDKDFNLNQINCYKVNCDSIIHSHTTGPLIKEIFLEKLDQLNIELEL